MQPEYPTTSVHSSLRFKESVGEEAVGSVWRDDEVTVRPVPSEIPESFLDGLRDFEAGRVVDLDQALNDEPPNQ